MRLIRFHKLLAISSLRQSPKPFLLSQGRMKTRANSQAKSESPRPEISNVEVPTTSSRKKRKTKKDPSSKIEVSSLTNKESSSTSTVQTSPWYSFFTKGDPEYEAYMATEWGFEKDQGDDTAYFEKISLEGAQSGLSWLTILRKREAYRRTFYNFDPVRVAAMTQDDVESIVNQQGPSTEIVVRHRGKIESVVSNAKCVLEMQKQGDSFAHHLWSFVDHKPILNSNRNVAEAATKSPESEAMSKDLKKRGFRFVGPTTCYAMMQALGLVIDHPVDTPEWKSAKERLKNRKGGYQQRT